MTYYQYIGIIRCFHNLCVLYDIRIFYLKYRKILYVICYTPYSSIATHSALNFSINISLASLYSQSQAGSDEASTRTAFPTRLQSQHDAMHELQTLWVSPWLLASLRRLF